MSSRLTAFAALVFLLAASAVLAGRINGPFLGKINGKASVSNQDGINSGNSTSASPVTFDLDPESSADNLTSSLTINSTAMTLVADYDARDASAGSWPADSTGPTLTAAGSGTSPIIDSLAPFTGAGESVAFPDVEAGKYYQAAGGSYGSVGTQDFVFEVFFKAPSHEPSWDSQLFGSFSGDLSAPHPPGLYYQRANELVLNLETATTLCTSSPTAVAANTWNHVMIFADRSGDARLYINGTNTSSGDISGCATTVDNASAYTQIGSLDATPIGGGLRVAFARQWKCAGCIDTTAEQDAIALERSARLFGAYATAGATKTPEIMTRASVAYTDIQNISTNVRTMFLMGENAPRVARRKELTGGEYVTGLLVESQRTNKMLTTEDFSDQFLISFTDTSDTPAPAGIESDTYILDQAIAPDGSLTADAYDAGVEPVAYEHCFRQPVALTAQKYTTSFFIKAAEMTRAMVRVRTITNARGWINLSSCTAGTVGAGLLATKAEDYGDGWCRFSISYTGTAATHKIDVCATSADNVTTYPEATGNSSADIFVWGAQTVAAGANLTGFVTSYIPSLSYSETTRAKDQIAYVAAGNVDTTTGASCDIEMSHIPAFTNAGDDFVTCFVGASSNNNMYGDIYGNNHGMYGTTAGSAVVGFQAGPSVITGERVQARLTFKNNEFCQYVNGSLTGSCDTSGTSPTVPTMTRISLGSTYSGTAQVDALVSRYRYLSGAYAGSLHTY